MDRFVPVRIVQGNAMDLTLFQFDYDLTFAVFFMNADKTIYGRFASRSDREDATKDMTMAGFRKAMEAALEIHRGYPANKASLAGKQGRPSPYRTPDDFPSLRGKYQAKLDYDGKVVASCMHCHQVRDAERLVYRSDNKPIPDEVLYPWPMPSVLGLEMDPDETAAVRRVEPGSPAAQAGFKAGDRIEWFENQPILSIADLQWVLHGAPAAGSLKAGIARGSQRHQLALNLPQGWRRKTDIGWRVTSWDLRRMALGGLLLRELPEAKRREAKLNPGSLGLLVEHVGQYGEHAVAKKAGFEKGDILVSFDGQKSHLSESQLFGYVLQNRMPGEKVPVTVLRSGKEIRLELLLQ